MLDKIVPQVLGAQAPAVAFHFLVIFHGVGATAIPNPIDIRFQSVSGIQVASSAVERRTFQSKEIRFPAVPSYDNLILERGYAIGLSPLRKELELTFANMNFCPRNVHIMLLNEKSIPIASWLFFDAFPIRWSIGQLDATQSAVLIETLELSYAHFQSLSL